MVVIIPFKIFPPQDLMKSTVKIQPLIDFFVFHNFIIESVDSISRDERDAPLTQYITNAGITRARYTITFKHHHRILRLISNRMSV